MQKMESKTLSLASLIELDPKRVASASLKESADFDNYMAEIHHLLVATHPLPGVSFSERLPHGRELDFDYACKRAGRLSRENGVEATVTVNGLEIHQFSPDGSYELRKAELTSVFGRSA